MDQLGGILSGGSGGGGASSTAGSDGKEPPRHNIHLPALGRKSSDLGVGGGVGGASGGYSSSGMAANTTGGPSSSDLITTLLDSFKSSLKEAESYSHYYEIRIKCEEEYIKGLRGVVEKQNELDRKIDGKAGINASRMDGRGVRGTWYELRENDIRELDTRTTIVSTLKNGVLTPLTSFRDAQERIRKRVKEDLKTHCSAFDEMRTTTVPRIKKQYDKKCEEVETLRLQQVAIEDQKSLLGGGSGSGHLDATYPAGATTPNTAALARPIPPLPPRSEEPTTLSMAPSGSQELSSPRSISSSGPVRHDSETSVAGARSGVADGDQMLLSPTHLPPFSNGLGSGSMTPGTDFSPPSHTSTLPYSTIHGGSTATTSSDRLMTTQLSSSGNSNLSSSNSGGSKEQSEKDKKSSNFFDALRNKEGWENARKEAPRKIGAFINRMRDERGGLLGGDKEKESGAGHGLGATAPGALPHDASGAVGPTSGGTGATGALFSRETSMRSGAGAQSIALKSVKAKRESEELDKAYRKAIFDLETLRIRREKTILAAIESCKECKRELAATVQASWLQAERSGLALAHELRALKDHGEQRALHCNDDLEDALRVFENGLIHLDELDEPRVTYVNYWHGECQDLLFGTSLTDYAFSHHRGAGASATAQPPLIVSKCIQYIETHAMSHPGIYRISAKHTTLQALAHAIEKDEARFQFDTSREDPAAVAGLLKMYLRQLPEPVLPIPWEERIKYTVEREEHIRNGFPTLKSRIRRAPQINQLTLKAIVEHLTRVAAKADENKMTASNLAVVFGPVLLSEADHEATSLAAAMEEDKTMEDLITYSHTIFGTAGAPAIGSPSIAAPSSPAPLAPVPTAAAAAVTSAPPSSAAAAVTADAAPSGTALKRRSAIRGPSDGTAGPPELPAEAVTSEAIIPTSVDPGLAPQPIATPSSTVPSDGHEWQESYIAASSAYDPTPASATTTADPPVMTTAALAASAAAGGSLAVLTPTAVPSHD